LVKKKNKINVFTYCDGKCSPPRLLLREGETFPTQGKKTGHPVLWLFRCCHREICDNSIRSQDQDVDKTPGRRKRMHVNPIIPGLFRTFVCPGGGFFCPRAISQDWLMLKLQIW